MLTSVVIAFLTLSSHATLGYDSINICWPCTCFPMDGTPLTLMACQGEDVLFFPLLPSYYATSIKQIFILNTNIICPEQPEMYEALEQFEESENQQFNCSCLHHWMQAHPSAYFTSECVSTTLPSQTTLPPPQMTSDAVTSDNAVTEDDNMTTTSNPTSSGHASGDYITSTARVDDRQTVTGVPGGDEQTTPGDHVPSAGAHHIWAYSASVITGVFLLVGFIAVTARSLGKHCPRGRHPRSPRPIYRMNTIYRETTEDGADESEV